MALNPNAPSWEPPTSVCLPDTTRAGSMGSPSPPLGLTPKAKPARDTIASPATVLTPATHAEAPVQLAYSRASCSDLAALEEEPAAAADGAAEAEFAAAATPGPPAADPAPAAAAAAAEDPLHNRPRQPGASL